MPLRFMYITNNLDVAMIAQKFGVDRIFIDLETLDKEERQKGMNTVKSHHSIVDISLIKNQMDFSDVLVRVNPWNNNSPVEIKQVIDAGADIVMLPMWKTVEEVEAFIKEVDSKAKVMLLLETRQAVECLDKVLQVEGIDEIHIGLNDLHLSYGLTFMFELLANGIVESLCEKIRCAGIPYGFGGIARIGAGELPAEKILAEHYRLGSSFAILSRSFCNAEAIEDLQEIENIFKFKLKEIRDFEESLIQKSADYFDKNKDELCHIVENIVRRKRHG